jgi:hypothetical protein
MSLDAARKRLCPNCLTPVSGMYCGHCGQKMKSVVRHFGLLLSEFFTDVLNLDAKLLRTIKPLLFRPGFLSREYFQGRRMHYVSPLKLYFFLSIVTFFLIQHSLNATVLEEAIQTDSSPTDPKSEAARNEERLQDFKLDNFNGKQWNAKSNPVAIDWLPEAANELINEKFSRIEQVAKSDNWREQTVRAALAASPQALLIILPFFALLLKFFYFFQRRLFMEHMIVALHNHSFLLLVIAMVAVFGAMENWLALPVILQTLSAELAGLILFWVPIYYLLSLKRVYQQSWKMTIFKFFAIGFAYLFLIVLGFVINLILAILFL